MDERRRAMEDIQGQDVTTRERRSALADLEAVTSASSSSHLHDSAQAVVVKKTSACVGIIGGRAPQHSELLSFFPLFAGLMTLLALASARFCFCGGRERKREKANGLNDCWRIDGVVISRLWKRKPRERKRDGVSWQDKKEKRSKPPSRAAGPWCRLL